MAVCPSCGAPLESDLCTKCGAPVGPGIFAPATSRRNRTLYWILGGCLGLMFIGVVVVVIGIGVYSVYKANNIVKSPAHAAASEIVRLDPNFEIISADETTGIIRVRHKSDDVIMRMNVRDGRYAKLVIEGNQNKSTVFSFQSKATWPPDKTDWIPVYPDKSSGAQFSFALDGRSGSCFFKTMHSGARVASFYESAFKKAGFTVSVYKNGRIVAKDFNNKRKAYVSVRSSNTITNVYIEFNLNE
jgi:hypothetical protein